MTTAQNQTSSITKSDQPMSAFTITETDDQYIVTLNGEWIGTFASKYGANLHVACIAA